MINQIDHIVEHLFHKKKLDDVSVYELERFIATHPYFAAGHFLLAKKNQSEDTKHFKDNIATAALYYHNSLWLQWLLDQDFSAVSQNQEEIQPALDHHESIQDEQTADTAISVEHQHAEISDQSRQNREDSEINPFQHDEPLQEKEFSSVSESIDSSPSLDHEETVNAYHQDLTNGPETDIPVTQSESE